MTKKLKKAIVKALKAEGKDRILQAWNKYQHDWIGNTTRSDKYITKEQFLKNWNATSRQMTINAKVDRDLYGWDAKKPYVKMTENGCPISIGKFYCWGFVDLKDEYFLETVYQYRECFGFYWDI